MHFKYENLKNYAPTNIAYCASAQLGVPLLFGANFIMNKIEYYKNLSLELLTGYDDDGNFHIEEFKDIPKYKGYYQASTFGRVKSLIRTGRTQNIILTQTLNSKGYPSIWLYKGKKIRISAHILVALTFIPNTENKPQVNHIDLIKTNCFEWNLEWTTQRENVIHHRKTLNSSSQYTGVCWCKRRKKWQANIVVKGKKYHLGYYIEEFDAHLSYQKAYKEVNEGTFVKLKSYP